MPKLWIDWPIGTPEERLAAGGQRLPGLWQNVNPFNNPYRLGNAKTINAIHTGVDLDLNSPHWNSDAGMPIYSPCNGLVTYSGLGGGTWGWLIVVAGQDDLGNVFYCRMAHVNHKQFKVPTKGSVVTMGQEIALVGNADGVYANGGDHLHFDVCYTSLLQQHPNDWPGMNQAYLLANYADPVEVIKHQALPQVPIQEVLSVTADGDGLRLRSGPGVGYPAITSFRAGTKLTVTEIVANGSDVWRKVIAPKVGYSAEKYKGGVYLAPIPPPPPPQPKPVAYSRHSVHYMAGGNWDYWAAILRQRSAMGKPVPGMLICSMNWSGEPTPEMAIQAGALECIWRDFPGESRWAGWQDVQGSYQAGYDFVLHCRLPAGNLDKTYLQILNEPTVVGPGTASYWNGAMDGAKVRSVSEKRPVRLAVGCFSWGFPDYSFWPSFFDVLRRVRDEGHRFMLHQYRPDPDNDAGASQAEFVASVLSPDAGLRHQKIYALFPDDLKTLPLALGEFLSKVATRIPPDWYKAAIQAYSAAIANDPIIYLCHWTAGTGGGAWKDSDLYNDKVDAIGAA